MRSRIALVPGGAFHFKPGMAVVVAGQVVRVRKILDNDAVLVDRPLWWRAWRWLKTTAAVLRG